MFISKATITIKVKLYSGLDRLIKMSAYDPETGYDLNISANSKLKQVAKKLGLKNRGPIVYFINGRKAKLKERLKNGDIEKGSLMAGQSVGLVDKIQSVREIIGEMIDIAEGEMQRLHSLFNQPGDAAP